MSEPDAATAAPTRHRDGWPLSWPAIAVVAALFVVLAILAGTIGTLPGDLWISVHLQRLQGQPWRGLWHLGNAFGTSAWIVWIALAGLIVAAGMRQWRDVGLILGVLVLRLTMTPLKGIVQSPRPASSQVHIVEVVEGFGFPSGHTLTATVLFGTVAVLLVRHLTPSWTPRLAIGLWIVGVTITGFARVWSGAHWTSDVLGAMILGVASIGVAAHLSAFVPGSGNPQSGSVGMPGGCEAIEKEG